MPRSTPTHDFVGVLSRDYEWSRVIQTPQNSSFIGRTPRSDAGREFKLVELLKIARRSDAWPDADDQRCGTLEYGSTQRCRCPEFDHGPEAHGRASEYELGFRVLSRIAGVVAFFQTHKQKRPISIISWSKFDILVGYGGFFTEWWSGRPGTEHCRIWWYDIIIYQLITYHVTCGTLIVPAHQEPTSSISTWPAPVKETVCSYMYGLSN
jgi:hypothetical protein